MPRYQSLTTRDLDVELLHVSVRRVDYVAKCFGRPTSALLRDFQAYEALLDARLQLSIDLDKNTDPSKHSPLSLSVRRMRFGKSYEERTSTLDDDLYYYRRYFGWFGRNADGRWAQVY